MTARYQVSKIKNNKVVLDTLSREELGIFALDLYQTPVTTIVDKILRRDLRDLFLCGPIPPLRRLLENYGYVVDVFL